MIAIQPFMLPQPPAPVVVKLGHFRYFGQVGGPAGCSYEGFDTQGNKILDGSVDFTLEQNASAWTDADVPNFVAANLGMTPA